MKFRLKLTRDRAILIFIVILIFVSISILYFYFPWPIYSVNYSGIILNFRVNLREAVEIPVYPSESAVYYEMMDPLVKNITIVFKPTDKNESIYTLQSFEIAHKLTLGYLAKGSEPTFNVINVTSYENLSGKIQNPIIVLVAPVYSNETSITTYPEHAIFIKAKTEKEFDLATAKFIMAALGIKI